VRLTHDEVFKDSEAYIVYEGYAPYVIIPLSNPSEFKTLVDAANQAMNDDIDTVDDDEPQYRKSKAEGDEEQQSEPNIYLWANWAEGEDYAKSQEDQKVADKIIAQFLSTNIYYENSDVKETEINMSADLLMKREITTPRNFARPTPLPYLSKIYLMPILMIIKSSTSFHTPIVAEVESILTYGMSVSLSISKTLIATLVVAAVVALVLAFFFRIGGRFGNDFNRRVFLCHLSDFCRLPRRINIAGLLALLLVAAASLVAGILHLTKFKEEVYRGRNFKKANTEAAKAMTVPAIDIAVIMVAVGVLSYVIGGALVASFGTMLVIGGVVSLAVNLIILRVMTWLVTNTTALQGNNKVFI
jgi:hypothetical protein